MIDDTAIAVFQGPRVFGRVIFQRITDEATLVDIKLQVKGAKGGVPRRRMLGCHVHQYGNIADGCIAHRGDILFLGEHWNPDSTAHPNHAGDLVNNIALDMTGTARIQYIDVRGLLKDCNRNIIGRSVAVHGGTDDCGQRADAESMKSGHAGHMLGCAVIGRATRASTNEMLDKEQRQFTYEDAVTCPEPEEPEIEQVAVAAVSVQKGRASSSDYGLASRRPCRNIIGLRPRD